MPKLPERVIAPPSSEDKELKDFSAKIQRNFQDIFLVAHSHPVNTSAPVASFGAVGDIYLVNDASLANRRLYVKFADGWYYTNLTAA